MFDDTEMLARSCGYDSPAHLQARDVLVHLEPGRWVPLSELVD